MRSVLTWAACAAVCLCTSVQAQQTTQQGVLGASGDAVYVLRVQGSNGVVYNCKDEITTVNGAPGRECIREGADAGTLFASGTGLAGGGAVAAGAVGFLALAALAGSGSSSTTTTPDS